MSRSRLYPEPPHVSAGFYLDKLGPREGFTRVCEALIATGGTPTGEVELVRSLHFPRFTMISDLASQLETTKLDIRKGQDDKAWKQMVQTHSSGKQLLRAGFETPRAGLAVVAFEPIPDNADKDSLHPISVTMSGSLISMPAQVSLSKTNRQQAITLGRFLLTVFRSVCESLEPLYGGIVVEASFPSPEEMANDTARMGTELFLSRRLEELDPQLERDMGIIFLTGSSERWKTGTFFSGWSIFNSDVRTVDRPLEVGSMAARRLARALKLVQG